MVVHDIINLFPLILLNRHVTINLFHYLCHFVPDIISLHLSRQIIMTFWPPFQINGVIYTLDHLRASTIVAVRPASDDFPTRKLRIFVVYTDHCFTAHQAESELWVYPYAPGKHQRYFCPQRHSYSFRLPELINKLINENALLGRTLHQHQETFYYLETHYMGVDYCLFFEITKNKHPVGDIRLKVMTSYPREKWAGPVGVNGWFSFWHIFDARMKGLKLPTRRR